MGEKEKEIMTVKQVAEYLQMNEHTIYKLARSGQIPAIKIAGQWRFKKDVIDKWISEKSLERVATNLNCPGSAGIGQIRLRN
ncbi:MAG: helix-turn-helix domain-containing protein [Candidatus Desulfofervidaceae bacterium]|nr:helix-turn-helix domain-containing protein [Candidatus Desulfofervidaceae bacterium]